METRKVIVRVKKAEPIIEQVNKERFNRRSEERKALRKPTKAELLEKEGLRFFNFVMNIEHTQKWCAMCESKGIKPNDRIIELIKNDMDGANK